MRRTAVFASVVLAVSSSCALVAGLEEGRLRAPSDPNEGGAIDGVAASDGSPFDGAGQPCTPVFPFGFCANFDVGGFQQGWQQYEPQGGFMSLETVDYKSGPHSLFAKSLNGYQGPRLLSPDQPFATTLLGARCEVSVLHRAIGLHDGRFSLLDFTLRERTAGGFSLRLISGSSYVGMQWQYSAGGAGSASGLIDVTASAAAPIGAWQRYGLHADIAQAQIRVTVDGAEKGMRSVLGQGPNDVGSAQIQLGTISLGGTALGPWEVLFDDLQCHFDIAGTR